MVDFCPKGQKSSEVSRSSFIVAGVPHKTAGFVGWLIVHRY
jgi:hypothetical protein